MTAAEHHRKVGSFKRWPKKSIAIQNMSGQGYSSAAFKALTIYW